MSKSCLAEGFLPDFALRPWMGLFMEAWSDGVRFLSTIRSAFSVRSGALDMLTKRRGRAGPLPDLVPVNDLGGLLRCLRVRFGQRLLRLAASGSLRDRLPPRPLFSKTL